MEDHLVQPPDFITRKPRKNNKETAKAKADWNRLEHRLESVCQSPILTFPTTSPAFQNYSFPLETCYSPTIE